MNLYDYCQENKIVVNLACEVGFWRLADSQIKEFIENDIPCLIIDVIPCDVSEWPNVKFIQKGMGFIGVQNVRFNKHGSSTYAHGIKSPVVINKGYNPKDKDDIFYCNMATFDTIDVGNIDIISIDIEGLEWAVLCNMKSLPKIIEVEMEWKKYRNPYYDTIKHWMKINGYQFLEQDGSDHIYLRTT